MSLVGTRPILQDGRFAGVKVIDLIRKSRHKILATVCIPGGLLLYARWNKAQ